MFPNSPSSLTFCPLQKTTCPNWTIYSWQGFNSLVCPPMLKTNYRCVQSLNISVDVAKCVENVHKFTQFTHFLSVTKNDLSWLNNLFMERFLLSRMSTSVKNKLRMCWVTQHQCRVWKMFTISPSTLTFCPYLSWLNNLFMAKVQLTRMSSYAKNKLQMRSVTQNQCRRCQMCGKCSQIHPVHLLFVRYKNNLSLMNNLVMARFQLNRMSTYANNIQLMFSVIQYQCWRRQICGKRSQIHPVHSLFVSYKILLVLTEQSIYGKVPNH